MSVTASAGAYTGDTETVNVAGTIGLSPQTVSEGVGGTQSITILLSAPAPAGGLLVKLSSSNTNVATVPSSVSVTGLSAIVQVTGVAPGLGNYHCEHEQPILLGRRCRRIGDGYNRTLADLPDDVRQWRSDELGKAERDSSESSLLHREPTARSGKNRRRFAPGQFVNGLEHELAAIPRPGPNLNIVQRFLSQGACL